MKCKRGGRERNIQNIEHKGWERRKGMTKRSRDVKRDEEAGVYGNCENCECKCRTQKRAYPHWATQRKKDDWDQRRYVVVGEITMTINLCENCDQLFSQHRMYDHDKGWGGKLPHGVKIWKASHPPENQEPGGSRKRMAWGCVRHMKQ